MRSTHVYGAVASLFSALCLAANPAAAQVVDVEAVSLVYDPPVAGTNARKLRLTIRNNARFTAPATVRWSIWISQWDSQGGDNGSGGYVPIKTLKSDTVVIRSSRSVVVEAVDPQTDAVNTDARIVGQVATDGEDVAQLGNNRIEIPRAGVLETKTLSYTAALNNGARFNHNIHSGTLGCGEIGVFQWDDGVLFSLDCPNGGTAEPEAYKDFRLKNGWKVKSVARTMIKSSEGQSWCVGPVFQGVCMGWVLYGGMTEYDWIAEPQAGSDSPYIRMKIHGEKRSYLEVGVSVTIEGPVGTDPYSQSPCPPGCSWSGSMCFQDFVGAGDRKGKRVGFIWIPDLSTSPSFTFACNSTDDCANGYACDGNYCRVRCGRQ